MFWLLYYYFISFYVKIYHIKSVPMELPEQFLQQTFTSQSIMNCPPCYQSHNCKGLSVHSQWILSSDLIPNASLQGWLKPIFMELGNVTDWGRKEKSKILGKKRSNENFWNVGAIGWRNQGGKELLIPSFGLLL